MPSSLARHLEIMWSEMDVESVLGAHEQLRSTATKEDLPELVEALKSDRNNFWTRELISEPIAYLGGVDYLPELFEALERNSSDGHDNDTLLHFLSEIASQHPEACSAKLDSLMKTPGFVHGRYAEWLLEFCR